MSDPSKQNHRERFFSLIHQHLDEFVRHQLRYFESVGDLTPGELTPEDVVDAVLVRAYREFVKNPARREIGSWLLQLATEQFEAEVKRVKSERARTVHLEEDIPETPPTEEVSTLGDEVLEFYQPDEDLNLEDIIPDLKVPTPEQVTETKELQRCVSETLAGLPREWRRALLLRHVEEREGAELAKAIGRAELEMARILEHARQYLRQRLVESGCCFSDATTTGHQNQASRRSLEK